MEDLAARSHERTLKKTDEVRPTGLLSEATAGGGRPCVVSVCALTPAAMNATWRAALVARDLGATLHILHPAADARVLTQTEKLLQDLTDDIRQRTRLHVVVEPVKGSVLQRAVAVSRDAAMVVLPSNRGNPLREWIMGTPAERLIRLCRCPVLVVKRPALVSYRRVLVPVDLERQSSTLIGLASSLSRGSRIELLHALDVSDEKALREMGASEEAVRSFRQHQAQRAFLAAHQLAGAFDARGPGAEAVIEFGDAAEVVLARARESDAQLMVIGKRRRGLLADYFLGGMTQRILADAPADVLVHPSPGKRAEVQANHAWPPAAPLQATPASDGSRR